MTHEDFLNDMYCFYSMNPNMRATNDSGTCFYQQKCDDGTIKKCAIGRWIPDDLYNKSLETRGVDEINVSTVAPSLSELYLSFLLEVQVFHDNIGFWNPDMTKTRVDKYHELLAYAKDLDQKIS
jgi:hypothetical protein